MVKRKSNIYMGRATSFKKVNVFRSTARIGIKTKYPIMRNYAPSSTNSDKENNNDVKYNPCVYTSMLEQEDLDAIKALSVLRKYKNR